MFLYLLGLSQIHYKRVHSAGWGQHRRLEKQFGVQFKGSGAQDSGPTRRLATPSVYAGGNTCAGSARHWKGRREIVGCAPPPCIALRGLMRLLCSAHLRAGLSICQTRYRLGYAAGGYRRLSCLPMTTNCQCMFRKPDSIEAHFHQGYNPSGLYGSIPPLANSRQRETGLFSSRTRHVNEHRSRSC